MAKNLPFSITRIRELCSQSLDELLNSFKENNKSKSTGWIEFGLATCCKICYEELGLMPYDEQLLAAWELYNGKIIEMATGEGKTISAVFAAFLLVSDNNNVHIMTFNDYLVKRDFDWMLPIYKKLSVSVSYITQKTNRNERQKAYLSDVVYITVKESGFDYLRDFVAYDIQSITHSPRGLCCAIIDEADSILIDEARIPLVIAGNVSAEPNGDLTEIYNLVKTFKNDDYNFSPENKNIYLSDSGTVKAENHFNIDNLFEEENHSLLISINDCLKAAFLLKQDKDYIVKDGKIQIIDEYTGRIAKNRHYPGSLQAAVEVKHDLELSSHGILMGIVPLQFFVRQYKFLAGMTGTAQSSEEEFELLYGLTLSKIPPHVPSRRTDYPINVYYNKELKWNAILSAVLSAHKKGQPVLIGTENIEESEKLLISLKGELGNTTTISVLNAKNDEMEAEIIKNAGAFKAITISANMAGRGVDILLGGADGKTRDEVINASGLLVISTALRESSRINSQLQGRAGRQGDVGESMIFTALDDELILKYELKKLVPASHYPAYTEEIITDKVLIREIMRVQRISEGDTLDERKRLLKFTMISEKHREAVFDTRINFINGVNKPKFWQQDEPSAYETAVNKFGEDEVNNLQKELIAVVINETWSEYLEFTSELRAGIHLTSVGGKNPSEEFNIASEKYYQEMAERVREKMSEQLYVLIELEKIFDFIIKKPENTWTFLLDESGDELVKKPFLSSALNTDSDKNDSNKSIKKSEKNHKKNFFSSLFNKKSK